MGTLPNARESAKRESPGQGEFRSHAAPCATVAAGPAEGKWRGREAGKLQLAATSYWEFPLGGGGLASPNTAIFTGRIH